MTRINMGISPIHLTDEHLLAEYREIVRIPSAVMREVIKQNTIQLKQFKTAPKQFVLGTGHVIYFYDKIGYLHNRFNLLKARLIKRNFNAILTDDCFIEVKHKANELYGFTNSLNESYASKIVINRIIERVSDGDYKLNRQKIDLNNYIRDLRTLYGM